MYTTRTRTNNSMVSTDITYVRKYTDRSTKTVNPSGRGIGRVETILDNVNPSFRRKGNRGIVFSDCRLSRTERTMTPGSMSQPFINGFGITVSGDLGAFLAQKTGTCAAVPTGVGGGMLIEAYAKMYAAPLCIGESLATLGETISMFRRPFGSGMKLLTRMVKYRNLRAGKTAASFAKASANAWLEYRYGWKPLILDGEAIIDEVHKKRDRCQRRRLVVRKGCSGEISSSGSSPAALVYEGLATQVSWTATRKWRSGAGIMYEVVNSTPSEQLASFLGSRARDLPSTVWELIPLSFVVDWFSNVGSWLQAVMPDPNINVLGHWSSVVETYEVSSYGSCATPVPPPVQYYSGSLGSQTEKTVSYVRDCSSPVPQSPAWRITPLSKLRQIDAVSLLVNPLISGLTNFSRR